MNAATIEQYTGHSNAGDKSAEPIVTVVEDEPTVSRSIIRLLETIGLKARSYANAQDAIEGIQSSDIGCLIMDMRLPDRDGLDLLEQLRAEGITMPAIVITAFGDIPAAVRAMKLGVHDFLEKPFREQPFISAVQKAVNEDITRSRVEQKQRATQKQINSLSERETQVLRGIIDGKSSKMIAADLGISQKTVENYRSSLMVKIEAQNAAHLVTRVYDYFNKD